MQVVRHGGQACARPSHAVRYGALRGTHGQGRHVVPSRVHARVHTPHKRPHGSCGHVVLSRTDGGQRRRSRLRLQRASSVSSHQRPRRGELDEGHKPGQLRADGLVPCDPSGHPVQEAVHHGLRPHGRGLRNRKDVIHARPAGLGRPSVQDDRRRYSCGCSEPPHRLRCCVREAGSPQEGFSSVA